jgi:hypothetical protein
MIKQYPYQINAIRHLSPARYPLAIAVRQGSLAFMPIGMYIIFCAFIKYLL